MAQARLLYEQSMALAQVLEHRRLMFSCLEALAAVAVAQGQPIWSARLWGAAENAHPGSPAILPQALCTYIERAQATARAQLSEEIFAQALAEGRSMALEQVLVVQGSVTIPNTQEARQLPTSPIMKPFAYPAGLTTREVEVLRLLAQGLTDAQIAERLVISRRTVNWHLTLIYGKIQVSSRSAATRYAIEHHLV